MAPLHYTIQDVLVFIKLKSSHHPSSIFLQSHHRSLLLTACPHSIREKARQRSVIRQISFPTSFHIHVCLCQLQYFPKESSLNQHLL